MFSVLQVVTILVLWKVTGKVFGYEAGILFFIPLLFSMGYSTGHWGHVLPQDFAINKEVPFSI